MTDRFLVIAPREQERAGRSPWEKYELFCYQRIVTRSYHAKGREASPALFVYQQYRGLDG
ncbi:hypothetical protein R69658_06753 [Paraburkholderia aspalathi]|jgi:hypothetical protein|uniref:Uncharacterized protein n=1 Tax=Paraburkholderia aspalathi TaxID=1324617 RepID=A0ABM8SZA7_9BURK|nr:hypothetical protein R20943_06350 [Paraburkholderia aspalathi]CAE6841660.1 hypothetical protein R69658_06753 [Paraburkholderia aspalathi]